MKEHAPTQRVLDILEFLSKQEAPCTLTEIAAGIAASKSTVFAVLHTMARRRFLHLDPATDRYSLGISAFSVGSAYLEQADFLTLLRGEMRSVVEDCGEICQMGILEGGEVLYLIKIDAPQPIRMASFVGKRLPAYATALGKAMLAALKQGDRVRTIGGIYGTISSIRDDVVVLAVGPDKVKLVFARGAISQVEDTGVENTMSEEVTETK